MRPFILAALVAIPLVALTAPTAEEAEALFQAGRWAEVERAYRERTLADPSDPIAWLRLGIALHEQGKAEEALVAFEEAEKRQAPGRDLCLWQARALARLGRHQKALTALEGAVAAGYREALALWREADFRPLHDEPRFVAVTESIEASLHPCRGSAERRAFDYWLGEWDVLDAGGRHIARSSIQRALDGCVIFENFESLLRPYEGKSFSVWREETKEWEQIYVDSTGSWRSWKGTVEDGLLVFYRDYPSPNHEVVLRMTYERPAPDVVRQVIDISVDGGAWTTNWAGRYVRRK